MPAVSAGPRPSQTQPNKPATSSAAPVNIHFFFIDVILSEIPAFKAGDPRKSGRYWSKDKPLLAG
jgi:hypothetical protein